MSKIWKKKLSDKNDPIPILGYVKLHGKKIDSSSFIFTNSEEEKNNENKTLLCRVPDRGGRGGVTKIKLKIKTEGKHVCVCVFFFF